jgi:mannose-6-phosphate isomerase
MENKKEKITLDREILLESICKDIIWGGERLSREFGKGDGSVKRIAETWELTARRDGMNKVDGGEYSGTELSEFEGIENFPLLVKLIDAKESLSLQVHPDDEYALKNGNDLGKTEMWYIVDALPGAQLVYGLKKDVTVDEFAEALSNDSISDTLNYVDVKKGDVFFIPAGCVHAIGAGILIAEIQQSSNITYRVYDFGRGRELHIKNALDVIRPYTGDEIDAIRYECADDVSENLLADCRFFRVEKKLSIDCREIVWDEKRFMHALVLSGSGRIGCTDVKAGSSVLVPKGQERSELCGDFEFLLTWVK